jgi:hypothetical protein
MSKSIIPSIVCWLTSFFIPSLALAQADSVTGVDIEQGEREIEFKFGRLDQRRQGRESEAAIAFGYGVSQKWFTQLSTEYAREPGAGTQFDAIEWENRFRLTESGRFPVDIGLKTEIERARERNEGYQFTFGPLFQKEINKLQFNLNVLFSRYFSETPPRPTELTYQWQAKYDWRENVQYGLQGFGEFGEWDDWAPRSEQSHRFGPAVFGKISSDGSQKIEYDAAYVIEPSSRARSHGFRMKAEYKF